VTPLLPNMYWDAILVIDRTGLVENFLRYVRKRVEESGSTWKGAVFGGSFHGEKELLKSAVEKLYRWRVEESYYG